MVIHNVIDDVLRIKARASIRHNTARSLINVYIVLMQSHIIFEFPTSFIELLSIPTSVNSIMSLACCLNICNLTFQVGSILTPDHGSMTSTYHRVILNKGHMFQASRIRPYNSKYSIITIINITTSSRTKVAFVDEPSIGFTNVSGY
ncbi:hypothetical protein D3C81_761120 [compost metagenome]